MTETSMTAKPSAKIRNLAIGVAAVSLLYTGAWYYGASEIKSRVTAFLKAQQSAGIGLECGQIDVKGFPFRYAIFCAKPGFADLKHGGSADAVALRAAAQVYQPFHVVWEMDGPLDATLPTGEKTNVNWENFQSSLQWKIGGLERSSLSVQGLQWVFPAGTAPENGATTGRAGAAEVHVRQNGNDLDAAIVARDVSLILPAGTGARLPPFSFSIDATLSEKAGVLDGRIRDREILHPAKGEIRRMVADFAEGRVLTLSGPLDVDEAGLVSGKLAVEAEKFSDFEPLLANALPDAADNIRTAFGALKAMADDKGTVRINLVLDKGQVMLGFIPLGLALPPV